MFIHLLKVLEHVPRLIQDMQYHDGWQTIAKWDMSVCLLDASHGVHPSGSTQSLVSPGPHPAQSQLQGRCRRGEAQLETMWSGMQLLH